MAASAVLALGRRRCRAAAPGQALWTVVDAPASRGRPSWRCQSAIGGRPQSLRLARQVGRSSGFGGAGLAERGDGGEDLRLWPNQSAVCGRRPGGCSRSSAIAVTARPSRRVTAALMTVASRRTRRT
jgi:hypothetical protein